MQPLLYFLENISINGKRYLFSFREIAVLKGRKFSVMTSVDREMVVFEMWKNGNWRIARPAPDWIMSEEKKFVEILKARAM